MPTGVESLARKSSQSQSSNREKGALVVSTSYVLDCEKQRDREQNRNGFPLRSCGGTGKTNEGSRLIDKFQVLRIRQGSVWNR